MKKLVIVPYKLKSKSARRIAEGIENSILVDREGPLDRYTQSPNDYLILNWGCGEGRLFPNFSGPNILNKPHSVAIAANKLGTFRTLAFKGIQTVPWTRDPLYARDWLVEGWKVMHRTRTKGKSGQGITVCESIEHLESLPPAKFYTQVIHPSVEWRVHVFDGKVIDLVQKKRRKDRPDNFSELIKSHKRGWVFAKHNISYPESIKEEALKATEALNLDFGAVDIIAQKLGNRFGSPNILEINTAPGIEMTTLNNYIREIKKKLNDGSGGC